jgi:hypothetical protein
MRKLLTLAGLVAAYAYFFDKQSGPRRRAEARDRVRGIFDRGGSRLGRSVEGKSSNQEPKSTSDAAASASGAADDATR